MLESRIHARPVFQRLLFGQSWEDPELDIEALRIAPRDRVLAITSGGCNALSLLTTGPRELIALDMSPAQSWLLELKLAGIRGLSHEEFLRLLGVRFLEEPDPAAAPPTELYTRIRPLLSPQARGFWDGNAPQIRRGVLQAGRYERFLAVFRRVLSAAVGGSTLRDLMRHPPEGQAEFYRARWDRPAWRLLFGIFFSRRVLGWGGLDPQFFHYVEGVPSFSVHFRRLVEHALTDLPVRENYFVAQVCTGRYLTRDAVPRYLHRRHFEGLREHAGRVRIVTQELERFLARCPSDRIDKFALSNVFEWIDGRTYEQLLGQLWRVGTPHSLLCYRNLLVPRERPASLEDRLRSHRERARRLLWWDRSFVYKNFVIEEVIKEAGAAHGHLETLAA